MKQFKPNPRKYQGGFAGWAAAATAVVGIAGASMSADAAEDAAEAQAQGAREADATQRYFYDTARADNKSFMDNGRAGNNALAYRLGIAANGGSTDGGANVLTRDQIRSSLLPQFTTSSTSSNPDYGVEFKQAGDETQWRRKNSDGRGYGDWSSSSYYDHPPLQSTTSTINEIGLNAAMEAEIAKQAQQQTAQQQTMQSDPKFGSLLRNFTMADRDADPVYQSGLQFGLDEGTKRLSRMASATGSSNSGATLKALTRFANDYGSTKAGESFNRFNTNKQQEYNMLAGISGTGQVANAQVGNAGMNAGNQISANQTNMANARGSSYIAQGNAWNGAASNAVNGFQQQQQLQAYRDRTGAISGVSGGNVPSYNTGGSVDGWDSGTWEG